MSIDVSGGAGGIAASLTDLDLAVVVLRRTGCGVGEVSASILRVAVDPVLLGAGLVVAQHDPGRALEAGRRILELEAEALAVGGLRGVAGEAAALMALAEGVAGSVTAYRAGEAATAAALGRLQDVAMSAAAAALPVLLLAASVDVAVEGPDGALRRLDQLVFRHPWLVDTAAGGLDGLLGSLGPDGPGPAIVLGAAAALAGLTWPPRTEEEAVRILSGLASLGGGLDEDSAWAGVDVSPGVTPVGRAPTAPSGVAGLIEDAIDLGMGDPGRVRVVQVPQADGSSAWILQLPGTQVWEPRPGPDPFDLSTNLEAMTGEATLAAAGATVALDRAMAAAGRAGQDDPVMLTGHSQGGILAAALASSGRFRAGHHVTDVVTIGSPVGRFPIPADVTVLSLEHAQDPVPRLDGIPNPDRPTWTTVRRDLDDGGPAPDPDRARGSTAGGAQPADAGAPAASAPAAGALAAHGAGRYLVTAREVDAAVVAGTSRSLDAWARSAAIFVGHPSPAVVTDYHLVRSRTDPVVVRDR